MSGRGCKGEYKGIGARGGFTLVEILLVVVLITLLASAGGGMYVGTVRRMQTRKAARDFAVAARYARIMAIEKRSRCSVQIDQANSRFWLVIDEQGQQSAETAQVVLRDLYFKPVQLVGEVKFEALAIEPLAGGEIFAADDANEVQEIVFLPDGSTQSAVVQIGDGVNHYTASIAAATGRVKIYEGTADLVEAVSIDLDDYEGSYEDNEAGLYAD